MGIARLAELVREEAPDAVSLWPLQQYRGRALALDASIVLCQFRTATPRIFNRRGEEISPLQGLFYRTLHLLESGIKPVFVFDGQAPALKQPVLARRAEAAAARRGASDPGTAETQWRRLREDCKTLLGYLGVPCVQAPSEAEATCAALAKSGLVWATATEDMDALAFGSPRLLRHLRVTGSGEVEEISLPHVLQRLDMTPEQFVDLCILLGCDYCGKVRGLGPKKALRLLRQHGSIEQLLQHLDPQKHPLPEHWDLAGARRLFLQPTVADVAQVTLEWRDPEPEALVQFLAHEKHMRGHVRVFPAAPKGALFLPLQRGAGAPAAGPVAGDAAPGGGGAARGPSVRAAATAGGVLPRQQAWAPAGGALHPVQHEASKGDAGGGALTCSPLHRAAPSWYPRGAGALLPARSSSVGLAVAVGGAERTWSEEGPQAQERAAPLAGGCGIGGQGRQQRGVFTPCSWRPPALVLSDPAGLGGAGGRAQGGVG